MQVVEVKLVAGDSVDSSCISDLSARGTDAMPTEFVKQHVLGCRDPGVLTEQANSTTAAEAFKFVCIPRQAEKVDLERRPVVERVELVWRSRRRTHADFMDKEITLERGNEIVHIVVGISDYEVDVMGGSRHAPIVAGHRTDQHVNVTEVFESPQAVDQ